MPTGFRQLAEKLIGRPVESKLARKELRRPPNDDHAPVGRDHIDVIRLHARLVACVHEIVGLSQQQCLAGLIGILVRHEPPHDRR